MNSTGNPAVMRRIFDEVINGKHRGGGGMREAFADLHEQFPDVRVEGRVAREGDLVAARVTFSGTPAGETERIHWPEMVFTRFAVRSVP